MMDIWMIFAVICAYMVKGMCGFANTLVFSTILSFQRSNINISPVELLVGYPSNVVIAVKERHALSAKVYLPLSLMVIAGSIPGAFLLKNGDTRWIKILFGFAVAGIGIEMISRERKMNQQEKGRKNSPAVLGIIGILSGLLCGLFGIGALLAAYVGRTTDTNSAFRGNLCIVFLVENTFRIFLYSGLGILNGEVCSMALGLMPFMVVGLAAGMILAKICSEKLVKQAVIVMLILSGISLVVSNVGI